MRKKPFSDRELERISAKTVKELRKRVMYLGDSDGAEQNHVFFAMKNLQNKIFGIDEDVYGDE
jgi:hypothetical protein